MYTRLDKALGMGRKGSRCRGADKVADWRLSHNFTAMRNRAALVFLLIVQGLQAQYDWGLSLGGAIPLMGPDRKDGHHASRFSDEQPVLSVTLHYRGNRPKRTNLGYELQFARRAFSKYFSEGSVAGSQGIDVSAVLVTAHAGLLWRTRTGNKGVHGFCYGFQLGGVVGGSMSGRSWNSYPYQWSNMDYDHAFPSPFGMSLRVNLGFWYLFRESDRGSLYIEPNVSASALSFCEFGFGTPSVEPGIKLGWFVHRGKRDSD